MNIIEVEITSEELIKPSIPTPPHLRYYKLSLLEQFSGVEYTPVVYFYAAPPIRNDTTLTVRMKQSLSETMSLFYPCAGRVLANESVTLCNDDGVPLVVAQVNSSLHTFLRMSNRVDLVPLFVPSNSVGGQHVTAKGFIPMAIQFNIFDCGGVAIGCHFLHKILDGITRNHFFMTWAAITAGRYNDVVPPDLSSVLSIFPPRPHILPQTLEPLKLLPLNNPSYGKDGAVCVVKTFSFTPRKIATLQEKARSKSVPNPSRVQSVSCFIWKHLMAVSSKANSLKSNLSESKHSDGHYSNLSPSAIVHSVDMRPHLHPPLPPKSYGKSITHAIAYCNDHNSELPPLVAALKRAISETKDTTFLQKFQGEGAAEALLEHNKKLHTLNNDPKIKTYSFISWPGVKLDFGFGMPVWIGFTGGRPSSWYRNSVFLIENLGVGLEAWFILEEKEMGILESDQEFLEFASPSNVSVFPLNSSL